MKAFVLVVVSVTLPMLACSKSEGTPTTLVRTPPQPSDVEEPGDPRRHTQRGKAATTEPDPQAEPPEMSRWAELLARYNRDGGFRYAALKAQASDRATLQAVARSLAAAAPSRWSRDAQLAFYINAYNILTVAAVVERWPIESVMRVDGFFDEIKHTVAGQELTLNELENDIIRDSERFGEPRIHFAVNCASVGCPPLHNRPFAADRLESDLEELSRAFVRRSTRPAREGVVETSQIFEWFAADFAPGGVVAFLKRYLPDGQASVLEEAELQYRSYDWEINARE